MKRFGLALDLKDDPALIAEYEIHHEAVWPEILKDIKDSGILNMELYRTGNRLFMIMETVDSFSFEEQEAKAKAKDDPKVKEWETLMWTFQQPLPWAKPGQKWVPMEKIFQL